MNRQSFLTDLWKPYPELPEKKSSFFFGRVIRKLEGAIEIIRKEQTLLVEPFSAENGSHVLLGPTLPTSCAAIGDIVAWDRNTSSLYLLSPYLGQDIFEPSSLASVDWSGFIDEVSGFFKNKKFIEVRTPYLVASPGVDHHIDFLEVSSTKSRQKWYLPTSPELALKKYLCHDDRDIFEIKHCFRDDFIGPHHQKEFLMIEWYRCYAGLSQIKEDLLQLMQKLSQKEMEFEELTVAECFIEAASFELKPETSFDELKQLCTRFEIEAHESDDWNDLFFRVFIEVIEPFLKTKARPVVLKYFPAQQASLSKINSAGWCERFELYWQGVELANAYLEVNDPQANKERFELEAKQRAHSGSVLSEVDQAFISEISRGMPPASGVALGLDRLYMLLNRGETLEANAWWQL